MLRDVCVTLMMTDPQVSLQCRQNRNDAGSSGPYGQQAPQYGQQQPGGYAPPPPAGSYGAPPPVAPRPPQPMAPAPPAAVVVDFRSPGYGLRDPNDCGPEMDLIAMTVSFFLVLIFSYLGLAIITRPMFAANIPRRPQVVMAQPVQARPYRQKGCLEDLCPCFGDCFGDCGECQNPFTACCESAESCRMEAERFFCCRDVDCFPQYMFADDILSKFAAGFALALQWLIALFFVLPGLFLIVIFLSVEVQTGLYGLTVFAFFFIFLGIIPLILLNIAGGFYFMWYFFTHGRSFWWIPIWVYVLCAPSLVAWVLAAFLGCAVALESYGNYPVFNSPRGIYVPSGGATPGYGQSAPAFTAPAPMPVPAPQAPVPATYAQPPPQANTSFNRY
jgi:hypothetical protein